MNILIWIIATCLTGPIGFFGWPVIWILSERQLATNQKAEAKSVSRTLLDRNRQVSPYTKRPHPSPLPTPTTYYDESIPFEKLPN